LAIWSTEEVAIVLVELGLVEQRFKAVLEVLEGAASVTEVARRYGVGRQTVHTWLRRYADEGLSGLADRSKHPDTCPHQMPARTEARILELRRIHPGWGPRSILNRLIREGMDLTPHPATRPEHKCRGVQPYLKLLAMRSPISLSTLRQ
jgi:transposase-like protein